MTERKRAAANSIDTIAHRLLHQLNSASQEPDHASVISIMSCNPEEGVTSIAQQLAERVSNDHKLRTLIVSYDNSSNGMAARLGAINPDETKICEQPEQMSSYIQPIQQGQLDVLTLDPSLPASLNRFSSWDPNFAKLREHYELILVDTGSLPSGVPLKWDRYAQQSVLVVDASKSRKEELSRVKAELGALNQKLHAVVLNNEPQYLPKFIRRLFKYDQV